MADVGGGAAHVEADDAGEACRARGVRRADHAAGGARQHGVLAVEVPRFGEATAGLHEQQARAIDPRGHLIDIAA